MLIRGVGGRLIGVSLWVEEIFRQEILARLDASTPDRAAHSVPGCMHASADENRVKCDGS